MTRRQQACFVAYAVVLLAGFLTPLQACQEVSAKKQAKITTTQPVVRKGEIQTRKYDFKKAGKEMDYVLYVPKLYEPGKKMPLVVALHGMSQNGPWFARRLAPLLDDRRFVLFPDGPLPFEVNRDDGSRRDLD